MAAKAWRFPAEWEAQDAVLLAWPHEKTDWAPWLAEVEQSFVAMAQAILQRSKLLILVSSVSVQARAQRLISGADPHPNLRFQRFDYDDTWLRDTGPITLSKGAALRWLDFQSTGYGGKYSASKDDGLVQTLCALPQFAHCERKRFEFALEGGAIESDGAGTLLSTWTCMSRRHPGKSREQVSAIMLKALASQRMLWLDSGELDGDDTDAHIDTLARFASVDRIVFQGCDDASDPHFAALNAMRDELRTLRTAADQPYQLFELPWAGAVLSSDGRRLAATYANFLILNGAVLMPVYDCASDVLASSVIAQAFPGFEVISVNCRPFIEQNGSLHCLTMQLPRGCWPDAAL
jgi:agmatine/peptidylarginine deiminase